MLTVKEKESLYFLIVAIIGEDPSIKIRKTDFNEQTVTVVENMIDADRGCNKAMKELLTNVVTAGRLPAKKWLRKVLGRINDLIKSSDDFEGLGCNASVKIKWKQPIIMSTY